MLTNEEKGYIWLDSFPLTDGEKRALLKAAGSATALIKNFRTVCPETVKNKNFGVYNNILTSLTDSGAYFKALTDGYAREEIVPLTKASEDYPEALRSSENSPLVLYAKGNLALLKTKLFAVVGSRVTPEPVMERGRTIAKDLSSSFTILTGTAEGGDSAAIEGALSGSGKVICFFAGGFHAANKGNLSLLKKVKERGGLLLSSHPPKEPVRPFFYDERNKLIAQLSEGVLVLSAGEKSGALITAKYARRFKKPLFALPHPPLSQAGTGCNELIKKGAYLTETSDDIFSKTGAEQGAALPKKEEPRKTETPLSKDEEAAVALLKVETEMPLEGLAARLGIPAFKLNGVVTSLEVKGLVVRTGGNRVAIKK